MRRPRVAAISADELPPRPPERSWGQGLIQRLDHLFNDLLGVAKDHQVLVQLEEFVAETHIVAGHGSLVDDDRLGPEGYRR